MKIQVDLFLYLKWIAMENGQTSKIVLIVVQRKIQGLFLAKIAQRSARNTEYFVRQFVHFFFARFQNMDTKNAKGTQRVEEATQDP